MYFRTTNGSISVLYHPFKCRSVKLEERLINIFYSVFLGKENQSRQKIPKNTKQAREKKMRSTTRVT